MIWNILTSVATLISTIAFIVTALYVRAELLGLEKDRFLSVTSELFAIWQNAEFMQAQMWILHKMEEMTWEDFIRNHRGDYGEIAFHRVGSYYDRLGTLIRLKLINQQEILSTVGGYAIAVWQRLEPLVKESRRIENSVLFDDFEAMLPACYECYVPALGEGADVKPFSTNMTPSKITIKALKKKIDSGEHLTLLDVRQPSHVERDPRKLPNAVIMAPDEVMTRYTELSPNREIAIYCA
jgi:hypothetical protein